MASMLRSLSKHSKNISIKKQIPSYSQSFLCASTISRRTEMGFSFEGDANGNAGKQGSGLDFDFESDFRFRPDNSRRVNGGMGDKQQKFARAQIQWNTENLAPFRKDFYAEHPNVSNMSPEDVKQMRTDSGMLVFGDDVPKPFTKWNESGVPRKFPPFIARNFSKLLTSFSPSSHSHPRDISSPHLLLCSPLPSYILSLCICDMYTSRTSDFFLPEKICQKPLEVSQKVQKTQKRNTEQCLQHLETLGIQDPTAIQQQAIPMALSGRDMIGISRTGSGKTLTYLLPGIVHIQAQPVVERGDGPIALVLAPTRELTQQIDGEIGKFMQKNQQILLKHCAVYGGADRHRQIDCLRRCEHFPLSSLFCPACQIKKCTPLHYCQT